MEKLENLGSHTQAMATPGAALGLIPINPMAPKLHAWTDGRTDGRNGWVGGWMYACSMYVMHVYSFYLSI